MKGFSRETLIALIANIESREWRREYITKHSLPPEHPRASTTDDVECFFSLLRNSVGKDFTLKEVKYLKTILDVLLFVQVLYGWRRVTHEFVKRIDPDLPFYYYTSAHSRFYEGEMPDFESKPHKLSKTKRTPQI